MEYSKFFILVEVIVGLVAILIFALSARKPYSKFSSFGPCLAAIVFFVSFLVLGLFGNALTHSEQSTVYTEKMSVPYELAFEDKAYVTSSKYGRVEANIDVTDGASYYARERCTLCGIYMDFDYLYVGKNDAAGIATESLKAYLETE